MDTLADWFAPLAQSSPSRFARLSPHQLLRLFSRDDLFVAEEHQLLVVLDAYLAHIFPPFSPSSLATTTTTITLQPRRGQMKWRWGGRRKTGRR